MVGRLRYRDIVRQRRRNAHKRWLQHLASHAGLVKLIGLPIPPGAIKLDGHVQFLPCSPRVRLPPQHLNGIERAGAFHQGIGGQAVVENFAGRFDAGYWQVIRVDQAELDQD